MFDKKDLGQVKKDIETCLGQKIMLRSKLGRNRVVEEEGKVAETYSNVFVVQFEKANRKATFSYTDVLIKSVEISVQEENDKYKKLFGDVNTNIF